MFEEAIGIASDVAVPAFQERDISPIHAAYALIELGIRISTLHGGTHNTAALLHALAIQYPDRAEGLHELLKKIASDAPHIRWEQ